jgi:predicted small integral membrane protein
MTAYLAAIFFATLFMLLLHVAEWRTASAMATLLRSGSKPVAEVRRLRRAIRLEAAYYILILPYVYATFDTLLGRLLAVAAIYHWGGLAFGEGSGLFDKWSAGTAAASNGKTVIAMSAVAVLDIAEMALLAWLLWILVAPVTAVTGISAVPA